jgi:hypothetical protein
MLKLADHLKLPEAEAVTQKYGFIGRSGSGKSYGAMRLAELFLAAGAQIIALDWVGIWWSLRLAANGKDVGFPTSTFRRRARGRRPQARERRAHGRPGWSTATSRWCST